MRTFLFVFSVFVITTSLVSCKTSSGLKEAWDSQNSPDLFKAGEVDFATIKSAPYLRGSLNKHPWTDTYWPLTGIGFASRWVNPNSMPPFIFTSDPESPNYLEESRNEIEAIISSEVAPKANESWQDAIAISPAEKYDIATGNTDWALTRNELSQFANNRSQFKDISWDWMGHCHGWAPASFLFEQPKHAVLMQNQSTGKKALFTEGDVRGLLTKAASDNQFDTDVRFMGTRCNDQSSDLLRDKQNRIIDGAIGTYQNGQFSNYKPIKILLNNWFNYSELNVSGIEMVFRFGPNFQNSKKYWFRAINWIDQRKNVVQVDIFSTKMVNGEIHKNMLLASSREDLIGTFIDENDEMVKNGDGTLKQNRKRAEKLWGKVVWDVNDQNLKHMRNYLSFKYYKECRDLNAGAFHTVLARYLSDGGTRAQNIEPQSFVMDITRDDQVWNHPIFSFQSKMGEPTPIKTVTEDGKDSRDPYWKWRARGTKKIVDVFTEAVYGVENGPYVTYKPEDNTMNNVIYHYTLELDKDNKVIGGEWHGLKSSNDRTLAPASGAALHKSLRDIINAESWMSEVNSPDFIWGYEKGTFVTDGPIIRADFVRRVHECSVNDNLQKTKHTVNNIELDYVECSY